MRRSLSLALACAFLASGALSTVPGAAGASSASPASEARFAQARPMQPAGPVRKASLDEVRPRWVEGQVLVRWKRGVSRGEARALHADRGARVLSRIRDFGGIDVVGLPPGMDVEEAVRDYRRDPDVAIVEPNFRRSWFGHLPLPALPDDTEFAHLWGLDNTGQQHFLADPPPPQANGVANRDIDAPEAWAIEQGDSNETIVAVLDSGIRVSHQDIANQLWTNPAEIPGNGVDDDENGFIDDIHGWNFTTATGTNDLSDQVLGGDGHGTHVAGTIAAEAHNAAGIAGVCPHCKIMVLKTSTLSVASLLRAMAYARQMRADVLNGSFGGGPWSRLERNAIRQLGNAGILAVFAAGNDSLDNDMFLMSGGTFSPAFPASYTLPNIISVAASNHRDQHAHFTGCRLAGIARWRCAFTNFGNESVDLSAPGVDIRSLRATSNSQYITYNGTSMAAPHVAGVAGLIKSAFPERTPLQVKNMIMRGVDTPASLRTMYSFLFRGANATGRFTRTGGRLNAEQALLASHTGNATPRTDGSIEGAKRAKPMNRGRVAYPNDVNDVFKRRLQRGQRYEITLVVPRGKDFDLWVYKPGTTEIHQFEPGCLGMGGPCKILAASRLGTGRNEVIRFRARRTGLHFFQVQAWLKHAGRYVLRFRQV